MKKVLICNIPMKEEIIGTVYSSSDRSLPVSDQAFVYPINSFLSKTMKGTDEIKALLLVKKDSNGFYQKNAATFVKELMEVNETIGAKIEFKPVETDFSEEQSIHEQLMGRIVDEIDNESHILCDITYGPKDLPIVLFTALNFAEKFLGCEIDNILYGQATFQNGKPTDTRLCDVVPLYYLNSVTETIHCNDADKARQMLKTLLSL